jgi:hypothetical protein
MVNNLEQMMIMPELTFLAPSLYDTASLPHKVQDYWVALKKKHNSLQFNNNLYVASYSLVYLFNVCDRI